MAVNTHVFPFAKIVALFKDSGLDVVKIESHHKDELDNPKDEERLLCGFCGYLITTGEMKIKKQGSHSHTFKNPAGIIYPIRCFAQAPGCSQIGPESLEFTWFPGFAWQIAVCGKCQVHLGWKFSKPEKKSFHGLIADRLLMDRPRT